MNPFGAQPQLVEAQDDGDLVTRTQELPLRRCAHIEGFADYFAGFTQHDVLTSSVRTTQGYVTDNALEEAVWAGLGPLTESAYASYLYVRSGSTLNLYAMSRVLRDYDIFGVVDP